MSDYFLTRYTLFYMPAYERAPRASAMAVLRAARCDEWQNIDINGRHDDLA